MPQPINILGIDIGAVRSGLALARRDVRVASPRGFFEADGEELVQKIVQMVASEEVGMVVVGLPRGMQGQETEQTRKTLEMIDSLKEALDVRVYTQDESLTSRQAEMELQERGKPYQKGDIDALAATYILQDFLADHQEELS